MQVVARYIEDRSVDVRHVAGTGDRNVIKLVSMCLDDGSVFRAETKKMHRGTHVRNVSGCTSL